MSIDKFGQFVRDVPAPEIEKTPEQGFLNMYESFGSQSIPPDGVEQPEGVFFWKNDRLEHYKNLFEELKRFVSDNSLVSVSSPYTGETIDVAEFLEKIEKSISFSEGVVNK